MSQPLDLLRRPAGVKPIECDEDLSITRIKLTGCTVVKDLGVASSSVFHA